MIVATCDRVIDAPADVVWRLLTTAEGLNEWMSVDASVDLRPGGVITWRHADGGIVRGEVREVVPMRRFVLTYGWEDGRFPVDPGSTLVTVELEGDGATTTVTIRHTGLTTEMAATHTEGWRMFVDRLAERAARERR